MMSVPELSNFSRSYKAFNLKEAPVSVDSEKKIVEQLIAGANIKNILPNFNDLYAIEKINDQLAQYLPEMEACEIIERVERELLTLSPYAAEEIYLKYRFLNDPLSQNIPILVLAAQQVLRRSLYFDTPEDAEVFTSEVAFLINEQIRLERDLVKHNLDSIDYFNRICESLNQKENFLNLNRLSIIKLEHILKLYQEGTLPFIEDLARTSEEIIENYRFQIRQIFFPFADSSLIEYIDGTKNYLFDYYGFKLDIESLSLHHSGHWFVFVLCHESPVDLENDIRRSLKAKYIPLPKRVIPKRLSPLP